MPGASASPAGTTFLTIFEVAAIMRVSKRTVYRLVHDGHHATGGSVDSGPAVAGGTVYAGSDDGTLYALDAGT